MSNLPAFDHDVPFTASHPPKPDWHAGDGLNDVKKEEKSDDKQARVPFNLIEIGTTSVDAKVLYKLMLGGISPRPVALVGTYNSQGLPNLTPVSWYQMVSHDPPLVMLSFGGSRERLKDSERNIHERKCFTISSSTESYAEALNFASINAPPNVSEFALTGLTPVPGRIVAAPRVAEAPFSMELELDFTREWDNDEGRHTTTLVIGRVKMLYIREDVLADDGASIDPAALKPVSRIAGSLYTRTTHGYLLDVPRWDDLKDSKSIQDAVARGPKPAPSDASNDAVLASFPRR